MQDRLTEAQEAELQARFLAIAKAEVRWATFTKRHG
jgi:hypothetical protein